MKGLIFDSDGTLFDIEKFIPVFAEIMREAYHSCTGDRMKFTNGECYKALQLPVLESCKLLRSEWKVDPEKYWRVVFSLDRSVRNRVLGDKIKPFRDVYMLKRLAQKYRLGILSNTPEPIVEYQLRYFKLRGLFSAVVCGFYKSDMCKPEIRGLKLCLERLREDLSLTTGKAEKIVAVTHHVPFVELLEEPSHLARAYGMAFLGSRRMGELFREFPGVRLCISGHSHQEKKAEIGQLEAVSIFSVFRKEI